MARSICMEDDMGLIMGLNRSQSICFSASASLSPSRVVSLYRFLSRYESKESMY